MKRWHFLEEGLIWWKFPNPTLNFPQKSGGNSTHPQLRLGEINPHSAFITQAAAAKLHLERAAAAE